MRAGLTAARVSAAAAELADEIGFDNVTITAVARRFKVADASLYSHVRNLHDLRIRVALQAAGEQADAVDASIAGRSGDDALTAFANAYRQFALEHPGRYAAIQMPLDADTVAGSAGHQRAIQVMSALLRGYGLGELDLTDAVRLLRSTFHGFVSLEAGHSFLAPGDVDASWARIVETLTRTLATWAP